jgi:A/G-specific adenine glycosylase
MSAPEETAKARPSSAGTDSGTGRGLPAVRKRLFDWYRAYSRDLPWRRTRDPWAILVSEVMLQQTTVTAVAPYYERFLKRWPLPSDLAHASRDELLSEWQGLGYYRRAHMLMDAACAVARGDGRLPGTAAELAELPGIGDYTAAAVASIAYEEPIAAVDGNIERVITRLLALPGNPRAEPVKGAVRKAADLLLDRDRPGTFNQAMMDLGATVCRPRAPRCEICPLREGCLAAAEGTTELYPELPTRGPTTAVTRLAVICLKEDRVLLERRKQSPNEGFYELPSFELEGAIAATVTGKAESEPMAVDHPDSGLGLERAHALLRTHLARRLGLHIELGRTYPPHRHSITRFRITVHPFAGNFISGIVAPPLSWVSPQDLDQPITTASRRILQTASPELIP